MLMSHTENQSVIHATGNLNDVKRLRAVRCLEYGWNEARSIKGVSASLALEPAASKIITPDTILVGQVKVDCQTI